METGAVLAKPIPVDMRSAALLVSDQAGGPLAVAVAAFRRPDGGVWVQAEIDGVALLEAMTPTDSTTKANPVTQVVAHIYAVGPGMEVVSARSLAVEMSPRLEPRLQEAGLRLRAALDIPPPPGSTRSTASADGSPPALDLRVLVWVGDAFALRNVVLPPPDSGPRLYEPRFGSVGNWLLARPPGAGAGPDDKRGSASVAEAVEVPDGLASRPVVAIGRRIEMRFDAVGPPPRGVRLVLTGAGGREVELPIEGSRPSAGSMPGSRGVVGQLTIPTELGEGLYEARLESDSAAASLPLTVALVGADRAPVAWPRLAQLADRSTLSDPSRGQTVLLPDQVKELISSLSLDLLRAMSAGEDTAGARIGLDSDAVVQAVAEVERMAVKGIGPRGVSTLEDSEEKIFEGLARKLPRAEGRRPLLGLVLLHLDLEAQYSAGREYRLARHALDSALATARRYAAAYEGAPGEAAAWVTLVGYRLLERGQLTAAEALLKEALELAPEGPAIGTGSKAEFPSSEIPIAASARATAQWGLGLCLERSGRLEEAGPIFAELIDTWPNHRPARLRMAIVRQRLGDLESARSLLSNLAREGKSAAADTGWIPRLAYQQLSRLALDAGQPEQALRWADEGLSHFPNDPSLAIIRGRALDLSGRLTEARSHLLGLATARPGSGEIANVRTIYNSWPKDEVQALDAAMREAARSQGTALQRALRQLLADWQGKSK